MPTYRVRFVIKTSIKSDNEILLDHKGHRVGLFLAPKEPPDDIGNIQTDIEASNHQEAQLKASGEILPPVLDALAFSTGTSFLLLHWDFILKREPNSKKRRAIYCEYAQQVTPLRITDKALLEAQHILSFENGPTLQLCWHRYALQRNLILDRFLFQWLAFEGLAGKKQIHTICPRCGTKINHCDEPLKHEGSDRDNGYILLSRIDAEISRKELARDIWGRIRNTVFHGTARPGPELLSQMNSLSPKLRKACDSEFNSRYGLENQPRPTRDGLHFYKYIFLEWPTSKPEADFADDLPWSELRKQVGGMALGEVRMNIPEQSGITLLNYDTEESQQW